MQWNKHNNNFFELRDDEDCLRGYVEIDGEGAAEIGWYDFDPSSSVDGGFNVRLGLEEAKELLLAIVEDRPARLVLNKADPYGGLSFKEGDRLLDAHGEIWMCDRDGEVHPSSRKGFRWTVPEMRACEAAERSWWPLRKV